MNNTKDNSIKIINAQVRRAHGEQRIHKQQYNVSPLETNQDME